MKSMVLKTIVESFLLKCSHSWLFGWFILLNWYQKWVWVTFRAIRFQILWKLKQDSREFKSDKENKWGLSPYPLGLLNFASTIIVNIWLLCLWLDTNMSVPMHPKVESCMGLYQARVTFHWPVSLVSFVYKSSACKTVFSFPCSPSVIFANFANLITPIPHNNLGAGILI